MSNVVWATIELLTFIRMNVLSMRRHDVVTYPFSRAGIGLEMAGGSSWDR